MRRSASIIAAKGLRRGPSNSQASTMATATAEAAKTANVEDHGMELGPLFSLRMRGPARPRAGVGGGGGGGVGPLREDLLVDLFRGDAPLLGPPHDVSDRVEDLLPPAVRDGEVEPVVVVVLRPPLRVRDRLLHIAREEVAVPEHLDLALVAGVPPRVPRPPAMVPRKTRRFPLAPPGAPHALPGD